MSTEMRDAIRRSDARENHRDDGARLTRRRGLSQDKFFVPERLKKDALSYEWHRESVMGQPDVEHQLDLAENHWEACQAKDMPGMMPEGYEGAVRRGGQVLMCRPSYLTEEAHQEVLDTAFAQVQSNEKRLGQTPLNQLPRASARVARNYVPPSAEDLKAMDRRTVRIPA